MNGNVKTFLIKLIIVIGVLTTIDILAGITLKQFFYKQKSGKYFKVTHAIQSTEDILIFGSSHASEHLNAPLMERLTGKTVFNFGNQGQSLLYCYPLVKSALENHKPKLVIVNLDYNELKYNTHAYEILSIFLPYYHVNAVLDSAIALMPYNEYFKCHSALYRYNSTLGNVVLNTYNKKFTSTAKNLGYDPVSGNICITNPIKEEPDTSKKINFDQNKITYLLRLIDATRKAHVKLLITTSPVYNYKPGLDNAYKNRLRQILKIYNIDYLDYGNNAVFARKCQYFSDDTHLNPAGADLWTTICVTYINKL